MFFSLRQYKEGKWPSFSGYLKVCLLLFLLSFEAFGQKHEIGIEIGGYNYIGDLVRKYDMGNHTIGGQLFYRQHLNDAFSFRVGVGTGKLKGKDDEAFDVFAANRSASFSGNMIHADFLFEYHFLDYRNPKLQQRWSPYLLFGAGVYRINGTDGDSETYHPGLKFKLPVGFGIKYSVDRRWVLGVSTSAISSNSDELDNVSAASVPNIKDYRGGNPNDNDWMFFTSISLSYTFYKIHCPQRKF